MTDFLLMVGTTKGAFFLRSDEKRQKFDVSGPHFRGEEIYNLGFDGRAGRQRIFASASSAHWGPSIRISDDLGQTWSEPTERTIAFPEGAGASVARVWQFTTSNAAEPDVVYAGVEPASLFRSEDAGETFSLVEGLWNHPHRPEWPPGGGGQCLHTVLVHPTDPARLDVAISTGGHYRSDDRGETWRPANTGIKTVFLPEEYPEFGQCVHKMARDPGNPDRFFLQHHWGIYRSDDSGDTWVDIGKSVRSDFGFPIVVHPRNSGTAYVLPLDSDMFRCVPDGACQVWRTTDAGESWEPLTQGLPQEGSFLTILRDGFCGDGLDPFGMWFGTRTGQVYGSADEGESWSLVADQLPPVLAVKAATLS